MLNVYDLEMIIQGRAREVEEGLRQESLVRGAMQSISARVKPAQQMGGLRAKVGTELMGLGAGVAGSPSHGQYIEDCRCISVPSMNGRPA